MTERTEHDRATRAFAGWLLKHPDATNTDRQAMKTQLGLTRDGPGMLVAVSDRIEPLPVDARRAVFAARRAVFAARQEYTRSLGRIDDPTDVTKGVIAAPPEADAGLWCVAAEQTETVKPLIFIEGHWSGADTSGEVLPGVEQGAYSNEAPTEYLTLEKLSAAYDNVNRAATDAAMALLVGWLTKPGTSRSVSHMARSEETGKWFVALTAGGFAFESETQETLSGAIRSALYAAELGAR